VRRALGLVAAVATAVVGIQALADATQNRPDPASPADATEVVLHVRTKDGYPPALGAEGLWAACRQTVRAARLAAPVRTEGEQRFVLALEPALGPHARRRLLGCVQDATIDDVTATVVADRDTQAMTDD
jgi:hypothetical protein